MAIDKNLIVTTDMTDAKVREIEVAELFAGDLRKLTEALGVTRKIAKEEGAALKTYKATGTLESGAVAEGETIPLSKYKVTAKTYKEITLKKWRKATTAEAIIQNGYDQAVQLTTDRMVKDAQKTIRTNFFTFLGTGTGTATGEGFQAAIANAWGQLQTLFEDSSIESVYFLNPKDVAEYLGKAQISTQTTFGLRYIEDFLGMGTVFLNSDVPKGKVYATAKDNIILYYIPTNGAGLNNAFQFTTDETGYIGIHEEADYTNMTAFDTVISGVELLAERVDGIVVGTITAAAAATGTDKG